MVFGERRRTNTECFQKTVSTRNFLILSCVHKEESVLWEKGSVG